MAYMLKTEVISFVNEIVEMQNGSTQLEKIRNAIVFADERAFLDRNSSVCENSEKLEQIEFWDQLAKVYSAEYEKQSDIDLLDVYSHILEKNYYKSRCKNQNALIQKLALKLKELKKD